MTKQEQRVIIFLIFSLLLGFGVKQVRERSTSQTKNEKWEIQKASLVEEFQQLSEERKSQQDQLTLKEPAKQSLQSAKERLTKKIDLNHATAEELTSLPKIGPAMAERIIQYRRQYGFFKRIEDIQNVKGIGPKTFELIKDFITVN